eukprot:TRINITY_DN12059_c0_g1_i1.p1 TRINITY_DN12059_c0_g1~~TRINITY_DN12059_c0_g1_i1.p1  ORF type:complete len:359 (-),score=72.21 TRINITY_DN12059_c0_g1_i1:11-1087(-)
MKLSYVVGFLALIGGLFVYVQRIPGKNGLGFSSKSEDAVRPTANLDGKNIIVTGGYSGIGERTVQVLARWKTTIWLPARPSSMGTCRNVVEKIEVMSGNPNIRCVPMDLSSLESVREFVKLWKEAGNKPLHLLVNNAGIMASPYAETVDGFESQFGTNHLGHFVLTYLLMDNLKAGKPSRVVSVSSLAHSFSDIHYDDLTGKNTWYNGSTSALQNFVGRFKAYGQSKTANILFSVELDKRLEGYGHSNALHPGSIATNLGRSLDSAWQGFTNLANFMLGVVGKSIDQGAATQVYVATAPELENVGGKYFEDCNEVAPMSYANDPESARKLWELSEKLTSKFLEPIVVDNDKPLLIQSK